MNNRGFTLVELLVTIVLLGVIASISFVSINAAIKKADKNTYKNTVGEIKVAAKQYASDNRYNDTQTTSITVAELITGKYLKLSGDKIKDVCANTEVSISNINVSFDSNGNITGISNLNQTCLN